MTKTDDIAPTFFKRIQVNYLNLSLHTINKMKTYIMIPTYNERENIGRLIKKILDLNLNLNILVVDDNSPDLTWQVVQEFSKKHPNVELLLRKHKRGRGYADIDGLKYILSKNADYIVQMDADGSHPVEAIPIMLKEIKNNDVVVGSRFVKGGSDDRKSYRIIITRLGILFIQLITGLKIKDATSGFRCFKANIFKTIKLDKLKTRGPTMVQEMLFLSYFKKLRVKEVPINFKERTEGKSKLSYRHMLGVFLLALSLSKLLLINKITEKIIEWRH